ncbi:GNAT family N-acetyltransferase [Streptomyces sp. NPDC001478]
MTTTLRPTGPVQESADGVRSRTFDVCDNGRPVGAVEIGADAPASGGIGTLTSVRIDEAVRRRGRGTIACLAAEEVLRGWGCASVRADVAADDAAGQGLLAALGYTENSRNMIKRLDQEPPALPGGLTTRSMTPEEYADWEERAIAGYAESLVTRGTPPERAVEAARASHTRHLPRGLATEGVRLHYLLHEGEKAGSLWVAPFEMHPGRRVGYVFDVEVAEGYRGRGYGRALMHQAERLARADGEEWIGLHVVTSNTPALRLYTSLGYEPTQYHYAKPL